MDTFTEPSNAEPSNLVGEDMLPRKKTRRLHPSLEKRERLLKAARELFVAQGYHATRPQDIAKRAGVGHGTFYLHFVDKPECFRAFALQVRQELDEAIQENVGQVHSVRDCLNNGFRAVCNYTLANPGVLALAMTDLAVIDPRIQLPSSNVFQRWADNWSRLVVFLIRKNKIDPDVDPDVLARAIVGLVPVIPGYAFQNGKSADTIIHSLTTFVCGGLNINTDLRTVMPLKQAVDDEIKRPSCASAFSMAVPAVKSYTR